MRSYFPLPKPGVGKFLSQIGTLVTYTSKKLKKEENALNNLHEIS